MGDAKDAAKAVKKAAKSQFKIAKKSADSALKEVARTANGAGLQPAKDSEGPTPAERSAAAAERQVRLQRLRVIIAFLGVVATLIAVLFTTKPWDRGADEPSDAPTTQPSTNP